jgi:exopolysaccharide biosynthesis polyprenyl glycosylphosphotransferase
MATEAVSREGNASKSAREGIGSFTPAPRPRVAQTRGDSSSDPVASAAPDVPARRAKRWLMLADLAATIVGFAGAFMVQAAIEPVPSRTLAEQMALALASLPVWWLAFRARRLYVARANERRIDEFKNILAASLIGSFSIVALAFIVQYGRLSRLWMGLVAVCVVLALTVGRLIARSFFARLRRQGRLTRRVLIVGTGPGAHSLAFSFSARPELGYTVVGFIDDEEPDPVRRHSVIGNTASIEAIAAQTGATGVVIALESVDADVVNGLARRLTDHGLHVVLGTTLNDIDITRLRFQELDGRSMIYIEPTIRTGWRVVAKRVFDLAASVVILAATAPVMLAATIAIKVDSRGPVLFRQERVGRDGEHFPMLKLRTMVVDAEERRYELLSQNEADGPMFKIGADPRVTRVGRLLRKYSIDELPQFWNVLRGEMSVVGPRPALPCEVAEWTPDLFDRLRVLPGITGMWQTSGRSDTTFEQYRRLDLFYVDNWSLSHDVRIVMKTVVVVLRGDGAR